jgi:dihydrodipicolinate synthase/N-acetylneuraminate lyase
VIPIHQPRAGLNPDTTPQELAHITAMDNIFAYILSLNFRWECGVPASIHPSTQLWTCNGSIVLPGQMIGAVGACMFFANWSPALVKQILDLGKAGKYEEASRVQNSMFHADFLGMTWGTAALKSGLNMLGYEATVPRRPALPLTVEQERELRTAFQECGLL